MTENARRHRRTSVISGRDSSKIDRFVDCCVVRATVRDGKTMGLIHEWNCPSLFSSGARLHRELPLLLATPWYWNTDKRAVADELLSVAEEGSFLVRRCGSLPGIEFVLSVKVRNCVDHHPIPFCAEVKRYYLKLRGCRESPSKTRRLLVDFIRLVAAQPWRYKLPRLLPKQRVPELKDFCRAMIRRQVGDSCSDRVDRLPLSKPMKRYLLVEN